MSSAIGQYGCNALCVTPFTACVAATVVVATAVYCVVRNRFSQKHDPVDSAFQDAFSALSQGAAQGKSLAQMTQEARSNITQEEANIADAVVADAVAKFMSALPPADPVADGMRLRSGKIKLVQPK